jgi:hypothetical protein
MSRTPNRLYSDAKNRGRDPFSLVGKEPTSMGKKVVFAVRLGESTSRLTLEKRGLLAAYGMT